MSTGAILQLAAQGDNERFLYQGNPDNSTFKTVFNKRTNFSMTPVELIMNGNSQFGSRCNCEIIHTSGDLLSNACLAIDLPGINSNMVMLSSNRERKYGVSWVEQVGLRMINSITLMLGTKTICTHTRDYLNIEYSLHSNSFMGTSSRATTINTTGKLPIQVNRNPVIGETDLRLPTNRLLVPLQFWFCKDKLSTIPIASLQYCPLKFEIELAPLSELINVMEPFPDDPDGACKMYVNPDDYTISSQGEASSPKITCWCDLVYLNTEERANVIKKSHEIVIDQVQYVQKSSNSGQTAVNVKYQKQKWDDSSMNCNDVIDISTFKLPTSVMYWTVQLSLFEFINNEWTNFTQVSSAPVWKQLESNLIKYNDYNDPCSLINFPMTTGAAITFNGQIRVPFLDNRYYQEMQLASLNKEYNSTIKCFSGPNNPINIYSFSQNVDDNNSVTGTCNFSLIPNKSIDIGIRTSIYNNSNSTVTTKVFAVNKNILLIQNGLATLLWTN